MTFNREQYRKRRNAGLRGQGNYKFHKRGAIVLKAGKLPWSETGGKPVGKKAMRKNSRRMRALEDMQDV